MRKLLFALFTFYTFLSPTLVLAAELEDVYQQRYQQLQENRTEQEKLKQKISEAQNQERTLASQIAYFNNQIRLTELQINETQNKIIETQDSLLALSTDIDALREKLTNLTESIDHLSEVLNARIKASYEEGFISPLQIFLSLENFSDLVFRFTYLKTLQQEDKKLLSQMKNTKGTYLAQKTQLEMLKQEKEDLKTQLEEQKQTLENQQVDLGEQKNSKDYLLQVTKNQEANYQGLLAQVQAEQRAIEDAINEVLRKISGRVLEGTHVARGEIIGIQGDTGLVTGAHLHFGYYPCGDWSCPVDPQPYLNNGTFSYPMDDFIVSQEFGLTSFARTGIYGYDANGNPKPHNGFDMVGPPNSAIKAAHEGTIYYAVDGWGGHGAIIRDNTGFITIYWHLQPKK